MLTDIYVKDRISGLIHKVGSDKHDSMWVDENGTVHYFNLKSGDGCTGFESAHDKEAGYEFVPSEDGKLDSKHEATLISDEELRTDTLNDIENIIRNLRSSEDLLARAEEGEDA